jgi:hypothetical protein
VNARLHERARQVRARTLVRRWELRQQAHAKGTWYRLRRLLAGAERVFVVSDADLEQLLAAGHALHAVSAQLHPQRRITSATAGEVERLPSARETPVRLAAELLGERNWVLVPFR